MRASRRSDRPRWTRRAGLARLSPVARTLLASVMCTLAALAAGCGGAPSPGQAPPPGQPLLAPSNVVSSASDSVGARPGSAIALFVYKFRQLSPPGSFSYKDRDLNFSFRPSPNVLYFGVENLQGRPVTIDWDRSVFFEPSGRTSKVGHTPTRWRDRFSTQTPTQVTPQQLIQSTSTRAGHVSRPRPVGHAARAYGISMSIRRRVQEVALFHLLVERTAAPEGMTADLSAVKIVRRRKYELATGIEEVWRVA